MRANQKSHYLHQRATHKFQVGDLVLLKKHNADKMDLRWEPNYRVVRLMSPWLAVVENQMSGKTKRCNLVEAWYSLEQYIGLKEDKLSSTTVDFIRSEGNLETKCLYCFRKPKMC